jgi:hypothetical protein
LVAAGRSGELVAFDLQGEFEDSVFSRQDLKRDSIALDLAMLNFRKYLLLRRPCP